MASNSTETASDSCNDGWDIVGETQSGRSTPKTDSSCEFVRVNSDSCEFGRSRRNNSAPSDNDIQVIKQTARPPNTENNCDSSVSFLSVMNPLNKSKAFLPHEDGSRAFRPRADLESSDNEDERSVEIQRLMGLLQERSRSNTADLSDTSNSDSDSDFVRVESISIGEQEMDESAADDIDPVQPLARERPLNPADPDDERLPDPDDRVESDMLPQTSERNVSVPENNLLIRHYRFSPNSHLNSTLTLLAMTAIGFAIGLAIGNYLGTMREAHLQHQIQEGQRFRLQAVQDDLLMCLRKQEDIDQTIGKLNEIEAILVDAEHWRNEYEELLKLKLANEETLRSERDELHRKLQTCHSQTGRNANTETLQRQETTLNSVHEKLEENLKKKDDQITDLQERLSSFVANLTHCTHMRDLYLTSLEDKSRLVLNLREQIFTLERQVFDYQTGEEATNSQCSGDITPKTQSGDTTLPNQPEDPVDVQTGKIFSSSGDPIEERDGGEIIEDTTEEDMLVENTFGSKVYEIYHLHKENQHLRQEVFRLESELSQLSTVLNATKNTGCSQDLLSTLKQSASKSVSEILNATQTLYTQILTNAPALNISLNASMLNLELLKLKEQLERYQVLQTLNQTWERVVNKTKTVANQENVESVRTAIGNGFSSFMTKVKNGVNIVKTKIKENTPAKWGYGTNNESSEDDSSAENFVSSEEIDTSLQEMDASLKRMTTLEELEDSLEVSLEDSGEVDDFLLSEPLNFTLVDYQPLEFVEERKDPSSSVYKHEGITVTQTKHAKTTRRHSSETQQTEQEEAEENQPKRKQIKKKLVKKWKGSKNVDMGESMRKTGHRHNMNNKLVKKMRKLSKQVEKFSQWKTTSAKRYKKSSDMLDMIEDIEESFSYSLKLTGDDSLKYLSCQSRYWKQHLYNNREPGGVLDESCRDVLHPWQLSHAAETGWIFERAAEREYRRETPDDWFWSKLDDSDIKLTRGQVPHSKLRV